MKNFILIILFTASLNLYAQWNTSGSNINNTNSGNVGIGTSAPGYKLDVVGYADNFKARFQGPDGYITIGPANSGWAHIYTDRPAFIFNQPVYSIPGVFSSYNTSDLGLQTGGITRLTILNTNGYAGLGTTQPLSRLHISNVNPRESFRVYLDGNTTNYLNVWQGTSGAVIDPIGTGKLHLGYDQASEVYISGKIGIGTISPYASAKLHVKSGYPSPWTIISEANSNDRIIGLSHDGNVGVVSTSYLGSSGYSPLEFRTSNISRMTVTVDGNIGIGTTSPTQKLTVNGTIYSKEVKVDLNVPGPDYVFEKDYKLPSLEEIKSYVDQHKHLPEVPSAKEMEQNGINLSEMNMILLKKVEELTLMMVDQNDKNEKLTEEVRVLQSEIKILKNNK